jgi:hypothetical protein
MPSALRTDNGLLVCYLGVGVGRFDANMLSASYTRSRGIPGHSPLFRGATTHR